MFSKLFAVQASGPNFGSPVPMIILGMVVSVYDPGTGDVETGKALWLAVYPLKPNP